MGGKKISTEELVFPPWSGFIASSGGASSVAVHPAEEEVDPEVGDQHRHESDQEVDVQEPLRAEATQRLAV